MDESSPAGALLGPAEIRRLAAKLVLRPTKTLGQNFVHDPNTIRRIVRSAGLQPGDTVLEIGPGLGSLTLGLLGAGHPVQAVEIDSRLASQLPETVARLAPRASAALTVHHADALALTSLPDPQPTALVANLPYNISVPVLLHLLATFASIQRGLILVQLEVADRLVAKPGSKVYGIPSAKLAWYGPARRTAVVPRQVFWPVPNVESGLVSFEVSAAAVAGVDGARPVRREAVFEVIDAAFSQRRKMLRSVLAGWAGSPAAAVDILTRAGVDPAARGETLPIEAFIRIAEAGPAGSPHS